MATKSIIQVLFESKNANSTIADINRVDKSQTRLAQTSASAGRTFAAQSQGLGGLVAAYAAAAATTFALQQAFSKLADAARTTQTLQGLASLATVAGESSSKLLDSVREITNSQLTLAESAAQINLSLSAGFSSEQIEGLSEVALKASRALGRDLTDAYGRVVRGSAKLETELLDELGIYTKIEPATRAYAAAIGKNVTALTEFERRQAFANSVIAEGQRKFSSINTTLPTSAEAIEAFGVKILDLTTKVGQFIADAVAPLATFLTNNLSNAFAAVGLAAGLVGSKGIAVLQEGIKSFAESGVKRVEKFEEAITGLVPSIRQAQESTKTFLEGLSTTPPRTLADNNKDLEQFIEQSKKGNLTLKETEAVFKLLAERKDLYAKQITGQQQFLVKQEAILETTKKSLATDKLSERQKEKLAQKVDRFTTLVNKLNNELNASVTSSGAAAIAYDKIGKSYDTLGKKASSLIATIGRGIPNTINFVGKAATSLLSLGSTVLSAVSSFTLLGTQIANIFGKEAEFNSFVMGIGNAVKGLFVSIEDANFEKAAQSLVAGALTELEKTDEELRNIEEFKFTSKILGVEVELTKTREDLVREVSNAFEAVRKGESISFGDSLTSEAGAAGAAIGGVIGSSIGAAVLSVVPVVGTVLGAALGAAAGVAIGAVVDMLRSDVDELSRNEEARLSRLYNNEDLFAGDSGERLSKVLNYITDQVGAAKDLSIEGFRYYDTQVKLAIALSENVDNLLYLQQVANELGVDAQKILNSFDIINSSISEGVQLTSNLAIPNVEGRVELIIINEQEFLANIEALRTEISDSFRTSPDVNDDVIDNTITRLKELAATLPGIDSLANINFDTATTEELIALTSALEQYSTSALTSQDLMAIGLSGSDLEKLIPTIDEIVGLINGTANAWGYGTQGLIQFNRQFTQTSQEVKQELDDIVNGIISLTENTKSSFNALAGFSINISDFYGAIRGGVLTLDNISQSSGALENSLQSATEEVIIATGVLTDLQARLAASGANEQIKSQIQLQINAAEAQLAIAKESLYVANQQYEAVLDILEPRRRQLEISKEIQESFKAELELAKLTFSELGEGYALASDESERAANRQAFLTSVIAEGADAYQAQKDQIDAISEVGGLLPNQIAQFNQATTETIDLLLQASTLEEGQAEAIRAAVNLTTAQADAANNVAVATEALFGLQLGIVENSNTILGKIKEQNESIVRQIDLQEAAARVAAIENSIEQATIQNEELNASIQTRIDTLTREADLLTQEENLLKINADLVNAISESQIDSFNAQLGILDSRYSSEIGYLETIAEITQSNREQSIAAIREQAQELNNLFDIAGMQETIKTNVELSSLGLEQIDTSNLDSVLGDAIQAQVNILTAEISNLQAAYNDRIAILDVEQRQAQETYNLERQILSEQLEVAQRNIEYAQANAQITNRQELIALRTLELQRQLEIDQLTQRRDIIESERALEQQKNTNALNDIAAQTNLNIAKEQASVDDALAQLQVLTQQENVFTIFLTEYARLINEQAKIINPEAEDITTDIVRQNFDTLISDLNTQRSEIEKSYYRLADLQRATITNNSNIAIQALDSEARVLDTKIQNLEETSARERELALETFRLNVELAASEVTKAVEARDSLLSELSALDENYTMDYKQKALERARLEQELAVNMQTAMAESTDAILGYYNQINDGLNNFIANARSQIGTLTTQLADLQNEKLILDIQLELDAINLQQEIDEQLANAQISNIQAQIQLVESQEAGKVLSAVEAAEKVNELQLRILDIEEDMLNDRVIAENVSLTLQNELIAQKARQDEDNIIAQTNLLISQAQGQLDFLTGLATSFKEGISGQRTVFQNFTTALAQTFVNAANAVNNAIVSALGEYAGERIGASVTAGIVADVDVSGLETSSTNAIATFEDLQSAAIDTANTQLDIVRATADAQIAANEQRIAASQEEFNTALATAELNRANQEQQRQNALADAADSGSEQEDKINDMLKSLQEKFRDTLQSITNLVSEILGKVFDIISEGIVRVQQANIDQLKLQEELVSGILSGTEARLSDVQSSLNETLEEEINLREQIKTQTEELVKTQEDLIKSFTLQDTAIADTSALYIEKLLEQKKSMISLGKASDTVLALQKEEKTLLQQQADQQQALESITNSRIAAEEKLATTQDILGIASDVLSGKFMELQNTFMELAQTIQAVMQMVGIAGGVPGNSMIGLNEIGEVVLEFKKGAEEILKAGGNLSGLGADASIQAQAADEISESLGISANALSVTASAVAGAFQGFSIGNVIAGIVGDTSMATSIGGAIGGAIASGVTAAATAGLITIGSTFLAVALPVIGPIIGALIGSLFKKTPEISVGAVVSAEGSEVTRETSTGGAQKETSMALIDIGIQSVNAMISMLESAGIQFTETVAVSIEMSGDKIKNATLQFGDDVQKFTSGVLGKGQAGAEAAAEFFTESFVKALQVGDLVTADAQLQLALDRFASIADLTLKTPEKLEETINFVFAFEDSLASLESTGISTAYVLDTITKAATENADALAAYYTSFLAQTTEVFGETSTQFAEAEAAVRENALALVGLGEITIDGVTSIVSLSEALGELNTGAIVVSEAIDTILNSTSALTAAGIENVSEVQSIAVTNAIDTLLTDISVELSDAIALLEDPANAAISELENIITQSTDVLTVQQGIYDELVARQEAGIAVTAEQISQAEQNIALQEQLIDLNLTEYLSSLSLAQLEVVASSELLTEEYKQLVDAQLEAAKAVEQQKAFKIIIESTEDFYDSLKVAGASVNSLDVLGYATDYQTLADSINAAEIDPFIIGITDLINNISMGTDAVASYEEALALLNDQYGESLLTTEEAAALLEQLNATSAEYVDALYALYQELESITEDIRQVLMDSISAVETSIEELGNTIVDSLENLISSTNDILGIYDDTLSSVAESGNKLFDLRDNAVKSLNESSKALRDFEKQNNLSGKTSAELTAELARVQANLNAMLADPDIDLAEFMQISALTSQQRYLQNEISGLTEVEAEYTELLSSRDQAIQDLTYAESVILSLGDQLIDTRKTESEIIQEIQEVTTTFVNAQQDLLDITVLLDEANFNLLQARIDEEDAVNKVKKALDLYTGSLDVLQENITGLLEEDLVSTTVQASIDNYALSLEMSGIVGEEAAEKLEEFTASALAAGEQISSLIESINTFLNPELPDASEISTPDYGQIVGMSLTNAFTKFNGDLVRYLDTEGLAQFYGPGGKFAAFRDALVTTLAVDGFDVLTISGGPLENFNSYLIGVGQVISNLVQTNATLDLSVAAINFEFGVLITAIGETSEGLISAGSALVIVGDGLDSATNGVFDLNTAVGNFIITLSGPSGAKAIEVLTSGLPESITTFTNNIIAFNTSLSQLTISNNLGIVTGSITNAIALYNSNVGSLTVSTDATTIFGDIATLVDVFNSTISNIEISTDAVENAGDIYTNLNIANTAATNIANIVVSTNVGTNSGNIFTNLNLANTAATSIANIAVNTNVTTNSGNIYTALNTANTEATKIGALTINTRVTTNSGSIATNLSNANTSATTIGSLVISTTVTTNSGNIATNLINANTASTSIGTLSVSTTVGTVTSNIFNSLNTANSTLNSIGGISVPTTVAGVSASIFESLNSANEQLKKITTIAFPPVPNIDSIASAFSRLLGLFTQATASAVTTFSTSINTLVTTLTAVRSTPGLVNSLTTPAQDIAKLTAEWTKLSQTLVGYVGSDGTLQGISAAIAGIAQDLADAWDDVVGDLGAPGTINVTATVPNVTVNNSNALSQGDKDNLKNIATNTTRYMQIEGVVYKSTATRIPDTFTGVSGYAEGGLVKGPGTSISDSIPTRLSNGEYVLKAETVKKLGLDALNMLNATGDITSVLASNGRYGDSLVAHINESEAALLKRLGGSGTRNPMTGLLEFFVDPGAVGSVFAKQEAAYLKSITPKLDHGSISANYDRFGSPGSNDPLTMTMSPDGKITVPEKKFIIYGEDKTKIKDSMLDTYKILNESNAARNIPTPSQLAYTYAGITLYKNQLEQNAIKLGNLVAKYPNVGTGPGTTEEGKMPEKAGTFRNRPAQTLAMWANNSIANLPTSIPDPYNKAIDDYVTGMNKRNGNFTDFYMLTNGGLVGDDLSVSTARDRAPALLEPGEFVLRKQAVDALGINNAMRLNATGDAGSDPNIEVNIVNNGTPVNPVDTPTIRKENGKLIVDIVLDDLRNNGPIKRQIKSIR